MKIKTPSKRTLVIAVLFGLVVFVALFLFFASGNLVQNSFALLTENIAVLSTEEQVDIDEAPADVDKKQVSVDGQPVSVGLPVRLEIPSININAPFEHVGLTPDGAMDVPEGPDDVAWFSLGPPPGGIGSSVIAGHYGWKNDIPAVFDDLHKLSKGDKIFVEDENGDVITFVVREMKTYGKDEIVPEVFFGSDDGKAHLNLVTCTGDWSTTEETFSGRLVVFTDKE